MRSGYVDYVVRGHGEVVFKSLIDALAQGVDPTTLDGLAYRDADGMVHTNHTAPIPHPDQMPEFPYHRVDVNRYARPTFMGRRTLPHHSSYGCPFFCNFCAVVNMVGGRWLAQSAERTANVARRLVTDYGADAVEFYDNNFFVHEARTAEFAERIMDLRHRLVGRGAHRHAACATPTARGQLMRDSGLRMVFMGAESGSDETLKRMNKGGSASTDKTLEIAEKMRSYGIVPEFSFVLGNPPDPEADVHQTLEFIRRSSASIRAPRSSCTSTRPCPLAGELYDEAQAQGLPLSADARGVDQPRLGGLLAAAQRAHPVAGRPGAAADARLRARAQRVLPDDHQPEPDGHASLGAARRERVALPPGLLSLPVRAAPPAAAPGLSAARDVRLLRARTEDTLPRRAEAALVRVGSA